MALRRACRISDAYGVAKKHTENGVLFCCCPYGLKAYLCALKPLKIKGFIVRMKYARRTDVLNRIFKRIMDDEEVTQYFLRHTFATTCQQSVRPDIVDIWMGDSSERLVGRVYTHFEDDFMYEQMQNVKFEI